MTLMSHHHAALQWQPPHPAVSRASQRRSAQRRPKRVGRPGACSLEFVNSPDWTKLGHERLAQEALPHEADAKRLAALMLAMASREVSGAARMYIAACIEGTDHRGFGTGSSSGQGVSVGVKSSALRPGHHRQGWREMVRALASDPTVITYFVRPARVVVSIVADDGSAVPTATYGPDLVVVRNDEVVAIDVQHEQVEVLAVEEQVENFSFAPTGTRGYPKPHQLFDSMRIRYERVAMNQAGSVA